MTDDRTEMNPRTTESQNQPAVACDGTKTVAGDGVFKPVSVWSNLLALRSSLWWRNAFECTRSFLLTCAVPAALLSASLIAAVVTNSLSVLPEQVSQNNISTLVFRLVGGFVLMIITMIMVVVSMTKWISALAAYARVFYQLPSAELLGRTISRAEFDAARLKAVEEMKGRKGYLLKFWLMISGVLVIPFCLANLALAVRVADQMGIFARLGMPIPPQVGWTLTAIAMPVLLYITVVSLIALIVSANSTRTPRDAAFETFKISAIHFFPSVILSGALSFANVLITAPQEIFYFFNPALMVSNVPFSVGAQLYLGATITFMWPLSVAPVCEFLRGTFK